MFSFRRAKIIHGNDESMQQIETIVQALTKDSNGRIKIKDLENALQRIDDDHRSKSELKTQVRTFSE
jgi:Ca2+-binding EF-hand superfamily protein